MHIIFNSQTLISPTCLFILKKSYLLIDQRIKEHKTNSLVQSGQSAHEETSTQPRGQRAMDEDRISLHLSIYWTTYVFDTNLLTQPLTVIGH